jgi:hypothetical protein
MLKIQSRHAHEKRAREPSKNAAKTAKQPRRLRRLRKLEQKQRHHI